MPTIETISEPESKTNKNNHIDSQTKNDDTGGWSFLQSITNTTPATSMTTNVNNEEYVHPMAKRSSSILSEKSLEMCTESLGSETGSITSDQSDEFPYPCFCNYNENKHNLSKTRDLGAPRRLLSRSTASFPPPLTTMNGVQVKGHREEGRLVMMAVSVEASRACFKAQREDGRLTLRFVEHCFDDDAEDNHDDHDDDDECGYGDEDLEVGVGVEKMHRMPSRCNEGGNNNREMVAWEHVWVASS